MSTCSAPDCAAIWLKPAMVAGTQLASSIAAPLIQSFGIPVSLLRALPVSDSRDERGMNTASVAGPP